MIREAQNANEYAFALGTLAHYAADNTGHPEAVNRAVALMFPRLRAKYGDRITYVQARAEHVIVEFSFDIVQLAAGSYVSETYHAFIGFQVAKPVLERAFRAQAAQLQDADARSGEAFHREPPRHTRPIRRRPGGNVHETLESRQH